MSFIAQAGLFGSAMESYSRAGTYEHPNIRKGRLKPGMVARIWATYIPEFKAGLNCKARPCLKSKNKKRKSRLVKIHCTIAYFSSFPHKAPHSACTEDQEKWAGAGEMQLCLGLRDAILVPGSRELRLRES